VRRAGLTLIAVVLALAGIAAPPAEAHPLGNFSVNHLSTVSISANEVEVRYVLDQAEIPTVQERGVGRAEVLRRKLGEIERGLYQHPAVAETAVIAIADETAGVRLLAYLTAREVERPSIVEMKVFCGRHLPSYMSPDAFVFLDALPRTSTNKVDYQRLTQLARQAAPGPARPSSMEGANA